MNPARDLLLQRHAAAQDRLDTLRAAFLADLPGPASPSAPGVATEPGWRLLWREVFVRARVAWTGLAAAGLVAVALNVGVARSSLPNTLPPSHARPASRAELVEERTRLLAELFGSPEPGSPAPAAVPAPTLPPPSGPRRSSLAPPQPGRLPA